jgi:hypothetical protein
MAETNESGSGDESAEGGALSHAAGVAVDLLTSAKIPAPLRRNALKAFNQLCTAAIEIPVAYLEGKAAEKRAETEARVRIISTSAEQIAAQLSVEPEYARAAVKKFGQRIVQERVNLDRIASAAAQQLADTTSMDTQSAEADKEPAQINEDWLNSFEREASGKSTEEVQHVFAKILAGEIRRPSSFSIRTVRLLGQLDTNAAKAFTRLCSLTCALRVREIVVDARVVTLKGNAASNTMSDYGLNFSVLNMLHEHGLIIPDYNSYMDYRVSVIRRAKLGMPISYAGQTWGLTPLGEDNPEKELPVHGVALTKAGAELLTVVEIEPDDRYTEALTEYFKTRNFTFGRINIALPG